LASEEVRKYEGDGFLAVPHLISPDEAGQLLREAERLRETIDPELSHVIAEPQGRAVRSIFRLHRDNEIFKEICRDPRVVERARQILGGEVYLHQSRINFKPAFEGKEF